MGKSAAKPFGFIILFILTLFSYSPIKLELSYIANNATLTNNGVVMFNAIFGVIWIVLALLWLGLAVFHAAK